MAVGFGELLEVGQCVHIRLGMPIAVKKFLPLTHHAEVAIVEQNNLQRNVVLLAGRELLNVHLDGALASHAGDVQLGKRKLAAHGVGQAHPHCAQPARVDPATRFVEAIILRSPHLMLPHIRGNNRITLGYFMQFLHDILRLDNLCRGLVFQTIFSPPFSDLLPPRSDFAWLLFS